MPTFDLHYHTNVYRCRPTLRAERLQEHRAVMARHKVDYVASTEHGYKAPLDAYLYLADLAAGEHTKIIPGVEAVSAEGVDIIFMFDSETDLKNGLHTLKPFEWSMWDLQALGRDLGAVTIIAHPFTPGRSGVVTAAGIAGLRKLLDQADYVEAHCGAALMMLRAARHKLASRVNREFTRKVFYTMDLPARFKPDHVGTTVSSDAHFAVQQAYVGHSDMALAPDQRVLDYLRKRVRFEMHACQADWEDEPLIGGSHRLLSTMQCVMGEAIYKKIRKIRSVSRDSAQGGNA